MTNKRVTSSIFEDDGRQFKIKAYDPIEGNYILTQVISFVLPFGIGDMLESRLGGESSEMNVKSVMKATKPMPKDDFIQLQRDILMTIEEVYPGGNTSPVVRENGTYGIEGLTMKLAIRLILESLAFNFKDFFEGLPSLDKFTSELGM